MANLPVPAPISEADYEAIEAAVMETARGRWFLAEYARRNRNADTTMLLKALDRIEAAVRGEHSVEPVDRIRFDLVEMSKAIARTKTEIAAIKPDADHHGKFGEATEELDSVVQATEAATSDILECAERIQEIAWTLREQGLDAAVCDLLDTKATEVYTACSFQDLTGQRTRKVIGVLRYLEGRINAMIAIWGLDGAMAAEAAEKRAVDAGKALLNGPARPGQGLDQADVDIVMGPAAVSYPEDIEAPVQFDEAPVIDAAAEVPVAEFSVPAEPLALADNQFEEIAVEAEPMVIEVPQFKPRASTASDPLESFMALSAEEKIALFT
jgi:chemotaxis regulatin CheY-phosphate phosphatase CheZ